MGKRHFIFGGFKLTYIKNEDVEPDSLQSPLVECSDAQGIQKTVWGALNLVIKIFSYTHLPLVQAQST